MANLTDSFQSTRTSDLASVVKTRRLTTVPAQSGRTSDLNGLVMRRTHSVVNLQAVKGGDAPAVRTTGQLWPR